MTEHMLVLLRHGESEWNSSNRFCGWVDVGLSPLGVEEAALATSVLAEANLKLDVAFTSLLKRANRTMEAILETFPDIPVVRDWRLNERHYGDLTGKDKAECVSTFGKEKVSVWRRGWDVRPPRMTNSHPHYREIVDNPAFQGILTEEDIPNTESLKDLVDRTLPLWRQEIEPRLLGGENVLIVAHGTSLRGLVKHIENLSEEEIRKTDLPNGIPFIYTFSPSMDLVVRRKYLADESTVAKAISKVANITRSSENEVPT